MVTRVSAYDTAPSEVDCRHTSYVCVGDVVLLIEESKHRNDWPLARVVAVYRGRDDAIRSCTLRQGGKDYRRPVNKLCLLESCD